MKKQGTTALVCEWLTENGGAEKVIETFHELYPEAPIYTSQYRQKLTPWLKDAEVVTGKMNKYPVWSRRFIAKKRQKYFKSLDLSEYDRVISITGSDAKLVNAKKHLCYCHVPTQYYWGKIKDYQKNPGFGIFNPLARLYLKKNLKKMRSNDRSFVKNTEFITISEYAKGEIKKYYKREAKVIHPPVNVSFFAQGVENYKIQTMKSQAKTKKNNTIKNRKSQGIKTEQVFYSRIEDVENLENIRRVITRFPDGFYINFSRQVNWKRLDLAIEACKELNLPLLLVGNGPEHRRLKRMARKSENVMFINSLPQTDLRVLLELSRGFIFPSAEPFGIAPVEALAAGVPVIALKKGGAIDYIKDGKNGIFFKSQTKTALKKSLREFEKARTKNPRRVIFNRKKVSESVTKFSAEAFKKSMKEYLDEKIS